MIKSVDKVLESSVGKEVTSTLVTCLVISVEEGVLELLDLDISVNSISLTSLGLGLGLNFLYNKYIRYIPTRTVCNIDKLNITTGKDPISTSHRFDSSIMDLDNTDVYIPIANTNGNIYMFKLSLLVLHPHFIIHNA